MSVTRPTTGCTEATTGWARTGSRRARLRAVALGGTLLAAAALALPAACPAAAQPYDPEAPSATSTVSLPQMLSQLQSLYLRTESATESYNQAKQLADQQRKKAETIDRQLADQKVEVAASRAEIGLMARQMYQDGGVSPYLSMLTGETPQDFFGRKHVIDRAAGRQRAVLGDLTDGEARLTDLNTQAQHALDLAQRAQDAQAKKKTQVESDLHQVEATLAGLTGAQLSELQTLEQRGDNQAQQDFLDSKALGDHPGLRAPSKAGDRAIGFAFQQLGKPYQWGAQGPASFDCSGLTSQAWDHAGRTIPRTSQQQWALLPHVPLDLLRPGDLVIYFSGATHVALYIGDGMVIQAPRPGSVVKVSPIAANPILGAVRPDLGQMPVQHYTPRTVPARAEAPTPIGLTPPPPSKH
ncbi:C40 family peptidase [Actinacidiphila acidipaludis]|uniref:C40 family peptidase n=1 Tax=Actinacidiphila acidipaludis TaxID=2873382 RepID=A0ABS7QHK3_9ACTN|nr:C40 family peptidase [Streptomyces acidipaludis]MBY8882642.1 C40 family peptidase [Streptomyces acidipaludis]